MLLDMYAAGKLKLDELVSQEYPLDQINEAYTAMLGGEGSQRRDCLLNSTKLNLYAI